MSDKNFDVLMDALIAVARDIENGKFENHDVAVALREVARRLAWSLKLRAQDSP